MKLCCPEDGKNKFGKTFLRIRAQRELRRTINFRTRLKLMLECTAAVRDFWIWISGSCKTYTHTEVIFPGTRLIGLIIIPLAGAWSHCDLSSYGWVACHYFNNSMWSCMRPQIYCALTVAKVWDQISPNIRSYTESNLSICILMKPILEITQPRLFQHIVTRS